MQTTPIADLPYPELTDLPNGPAAFSGLATALDSILVPRFSNASARNISITSPTAGQLCYLTAEGRHERYDGSAWRAIPNIQTGIATVSFAAANTNTSTQTYPVAFASAPNVFTNISSAPANTARYGSRAINVTATNFGLYVFSGNDTPLAWSSIQVQWVALGV